MTDEENLTAAQRRIREAALKLFADRGVTTINVSDLAAAAGVARGTIYNNIGSTDSLFEEVAGQLSAEMQEHVNRSSRGEEDPAVRLANGVRQYVWRAHEEPYWGRFICRFALGGAGLHRMWGGPLVDDLNAGLEIGRFKFRSEQIDSVVMFVAGAVLSSMFLVLEGLKTWRDAGTDTAELVLTAFGLRRAEAHRIATRTLPPLRG